MSEENRGPVVSHRELICAFHPHVFAPLRGFGEGEDGGEERAGEEGCGYSGWAPVETASFADLVLFFSSVAGADEGYWEGQLRDFGHDVFDCEGDGIFDHSGD